MTNLSQEQKFELEFKKFDFNEEFLKKWDMRIRFTIEGVKPMIEGENLLSPELKEKLINLVSIYKNKGL